MDPINYEIFKFDPDTARLKLALLKENFEYQAFFEKFIHSIDDLNVPFPAYHFEKFGLPGVRFLVGAPYYNDVLDFLNPCKEVNFDSKKENNILSKVFYFHGIFQVEFDGREIEGMASIPLEAIERKKRKPSERMFIADLSKKKKQLLREFSEFIDAACNQSDLKPDKSRLREEAWTHLKVWKLRKKRLPFSKIARQVKQTEDKVKKSFYRAFELTQNRKYDPEILIKQIWLVRKKSLKKTCDNCPDRDSCTVLCPEILQFVDQDALKSTKEKLLSTNYQF